MKLFSAQDFDSQLLVETGQTLSKFTIQIFKDNIETGLCSLGSGVLFSFEKNFFIVTASHNFIQQGEFVGKGLKDYYIQLGDNGLFSLKDEDVQGITEKSYLLNKIDLAVVKLDSKATIEALLENKRFLQLEDINFFPEQRVTYEANKEASNYYVLFGFPGTKTKRESKSGNPIIQEKKFKVKAYCQLEYLKNKVPQKLIDMGFNKHLFFSKIKKGSDIYLNKQLIKPIQNGMSGCGLWEISADFVNGTPKLKLAGIFTEYQMGFGIAVKLKYAIAFIRQNFALKRLPLFRENI